MTTSKKRERDKGIVRDRLVNDLSWGALALRYDLDERSCRRIVAAHRTKNVASLSEIDPEGEVWDHLQGFEAQIERMRDLREDARAQKNLNAVVGAERLITTLRQAKIELTQEAGLLPRNLGSLRDIHEIRLVVVTTGALSVTAPVNESPALAGLSCGGAYRDRTGDLRLAKPALSQLS